MQLPKRTSVSKCLLLFLSEQKVQAEYGGEHGQVGEKLMQDRDDGRHGLIDAHQAAKNNGGKEEQCCDHAGDPFAGTQWSCVACLKNSDDQENEQSKPDQLVDVEENGTIGLSRMMQPVARGENQEKQ